MHPNTVIVATIFKRIKNEYGDFILLSLERVAVKRIKGKTFEKQLCACIVAVNDMFGGILFE
jgi:hypothetical protein